jgi:hypothetical protein
MSMNWVHRRRVAFVELAHKLLGVLFCRNGSLNWVPLTVLQQIQSSLLDGLLHGQTWDPWPSVRLLRQKVLYLYSTWSSLVYSSTAVVGPLATPLYMQSELDAFHKTNCIWRCRNSLSWKICKSTASQMDVERVREGRKGAEQFWHTMWHD